MGRSPCCEKVGLKRGRWTAEEDEALVKYIAANGEGSWRSLPKKAGLLRCGKSCRLRWMNYLRADVKRGNISKEEEETILKLHASMGNRWSQIAGHLPGRTDNEIKNYWNSHLSRTVHSFRRIGVDGALEVTAGIGKAAASGKQRGGRTRRSAMKNSSINAVSSNRREKQEMAAAILTASSSSLHSDEGSSMVLDLGHQEENWVALEGLDGLFSPSPVVDSGLWSANGMEGGFFLVSEESVERESGVMSSSEERECGALELNVGRDGGPLALKEGMVGSIGEEEVGSAQMEEMLDWDFEGEMWPLLWDSGDGGLELQGMEGGGHQEDSLAAWLF